MHHFSRRTLIQHDADLYSIYGHLDYTLAVETGQLVERGQLLSNVEG
jgi:murein DD-endopeptidase MepM/ murein hydrolase activator NlpD